MSLLLTRLDNYLRSDKRPKLVRKAYGLVLRFFTFLFWCGYRFKRGLYESGLLRAVKINRPVVSVGNLTWGGTGKTPFVIYLASHLEQSGNNVVILTRGYKRKSKTQIVLTSQNLQPLSWQDCGDEPYLIGQSLSSSCIIVNSNRAKAARWAVENLKPDLFILDDGFQHWKISRDLDLVLVDSRNPFGNGKLIPLGTLREPVRALSRADLVVQSKVCDLAKKEEIRSIIAARFKKEIIQTRYRLSQVLELETKKEVGLEFLAGKRALAFCGIGSPESFYLLLGEAGVKIEKKVSFPDHYHFAKLDLLSLEKESARLGVDLLATTAKDGLKIPGNLQLELPVLILEIEVEVISGEDCLWQKINQLLKK